MALHREIPIDPEELGDGELAARAAAGDATAFEVLYRRHAEAAWRVAQAVAGNAEDAADAVSDAFTNLLAALATGRLDPDVPFRPYLLTAARNAAIDQLRRRARLQGGETQPDAPAAMPGPVDRVEASEDATLVSQAFRSLPERWRSVLWLTEVEGMPAREVGSRLGLSPNAAAQLVRRARDGLRDRFLQAHVRRSVVPECADTVAQLGAYAAGSLSARAAARVKAHLEDCPDCRATAEELTDIGRSLRSIIIPLPIGLAGLAMTHYRRLFHPPAPSGVPVASERVARSLAVTTAAVLALGVTTAGVMSSGSGPTAVPSSRSGGSIALAPATTHLAQIPGGTLSETPAVSSTPLDAGAVGGPNSTTTTTGGTPAAPPTNPTVPPAPPSTTAPAPAPPPAPKNGLGLALGVNLGVATLSGAVSGTCAAVAVNGSQNCAPPAPKSPGLTLSISTPLGTITAGPAKPAATA